MPLIEPNPDPVANTVQCARALLNSPSRKRKSPPQCVETAERIVGLDRSGRDPEKDTTIKKLGRYLREHL